jgi:hypothetical protein
VIGRSRLAIRQWIPEFQSDMTDSSDQLSRVASLFDLNDDAPEQSVLGPSLDYIAGGSRTRGPAKTQGLTDVE